MALNLRFAFVCQKKWQELIGNDPVHRFCDACEREIINLDPLSDVEREKVFRDAIRTSTKPCVFATVPVENAHPCKTLTIQEAMVPDDFVELGGEPELDDDFFGDDSEDDDDAADAPSRAPAE